MLKFILKKFRAVESAELELPGITVIAGKNGSGKSSISKVLYSILDTATRFDVFVSADIEEKRSHLFSDVVDLVLNFAYQLQDMPRDVVRTLFPNSRTTNPQSWILDAKKVFGEYQHLFVQNQDAVSTFLTRALPWGPIVFRDHQKTLRGCEMKLYCLLLSFVCLVTSYSRAGEAIALLEPQTNVIKSATVEYVPNAKIKVRPKVERAKNKIRAKVERGKDKVGRKTKSIKPKTKEKIRRKLFVPQASTN